MENLSQNNQYVGTIVGESTSREFRIAVAHETIREQDVIAVDAQLRSTDEEETEPEKIRIWAKVQRIERINPLFPIEAGHELAATRTSPFDTVLSLSREMVTAVCQILGCEPLEGDREGKLNHLRYPPQPASTVYRPDSDDIKRIVLGGLQVKKNRSLDIATLSNRPEVDVSVDGHAIVSRHLAILAMTGAGKSWAARRLIEELAQKNYPIVIFDPHGDYTGLAELPAFRGRVQRYYAQFPIFGEPADKIMSIIESLAYKLSDTQRDRFPEIFNIAKTILESSDENQEEFKNWLIALVPSSKIKNYGIRPNLYFLADFAEALIKAGINQNTTD